MTISAQSHAYPYNFSWSNGNVFSNSAPTTSLSNIEAGQYTVDITDNNGCQLFQEGLLINPRNCI